MDVHQVTFTEDETLVGLKPSELTALNEWGSPAAVCFWCLRLGRLRDFVKVLKNGKFSRGQVVCPGCGHEARVKTVLQVANWDVEEYAWRMWEAVFLWRAYEKVQWGALKQVMYLWSQEDRDTFWGVWRFIKNFESREQAFEHREHWREGMQVVLEDAPAVTSAVPSLGRGGWGEEARHQLEEMRRKRENMP